MNIYYYILWLTERYIDTHIYYEYYEFVFCCYIFCFVFVGNDDDTWWLNWLGLIFLVYIYFVVCSEKCTYYYESVLGRKKI